MRDFYFDIQRFEDFENGDDNQSLTGSEGNDRLWNSGDRVTITGGKGDDTIYNDNVGSVGNNVLFLYNNGDGNDIINSFNGTSTLSVGGGSYSTETSGDDVIVTVGDGHITLTGAANLSPLNIESDVEESANSWATITTAGNSSVISADETVANGSDNDDTITTAALDDTISRAVLGNGGDDYINNSASNAIITGGSGKDSVDNSGSNVTIDTDAGDDYVSNDAPNVTVNTGDGEDNIFNGLNGSDILINGGAGNDYVNNNYNSLSVTINTDAGNDTVNNYGAYAVIDAGDGDDTVNNSGDNSTINMGAGNDYVDNSGDNVLFTYNSSDGNDIINGFKDNSTLQIGGGTYSTTKSDSDLILTVGDGQITLTGAASLSNLHIDGEFKMPTEWATITTAGDSSVISADETVASGTDNADTIITAALDDTISRAVEGNAGNDVIQNAASNVTITGGTGDDTITNTGANVFLVYSKGDGNDVITGFTANDTLYVNEARHTETVSGNDLIVTVGDNQLTLTGAAGLDSLNITGSFDEAARAFVTNMQQKTVLGYPFIAGLLFHPTEYHGFETLPSDYYASSETLTINSSDGIELKGFHYTPENSNDKWAVVIHGYGHNHNHMNAFAMQYLANGYNVLMVDQRAAGESGGEWLTMGAAESDDIALWTQKIAEINSNAKIVLHGVSMGAATAMLAAANSKLTNVTSLVEDCGYTTVMNLIDIAKGLATQLANPEFVQVVDDASESLTGHRLTEAAPIDSIGKVTIPSMFITGESDTVVSMANLESLYSASGAEVKEIFTVAGATHGLSALTDSIGYANTVFRFNAEAAGEGWATSNTVDAISLRGTKYDDTISNSGSDVSIYAAAGNDTIINTDNSKSYIDAGDGNNFISNSLFYQIVTLESGAESLDNRYSETTIVAGAGNDSVSNVGGFNVSIVVGDGDDSVYTKHSYYNTIDAGAGNDYVRVSEGHHQNIFLGDGDDTIQGVQDMDSDTAGKWDVGGYAYLDGGKGNDVISFGYANDSTITGGDGDDYIVGFGANSFLTGGDGDDEIVLVATKESSLDSTGATISGGKGNDTVMLADANVVYSYEGGNDEILGMTESDTLVIASDTYRTTVSGDDLIVQLIHSKNTITLKNMASLTPNIQGTVYTEKYDKEGTEIEDPVAMIASGNDTYYYDSVARATKDADANSTVTVLANSTETSTIDSSKGLTIQFAESGLGVYGVTGGNFVSAEEISNANFSFDSIGVLSNGVNNLQVNSGATATFDGYEVTATKDGYTFTLQDNAFTLNGISYDGEGTATFDTAGKITLTSGAVMSDESLSTATDGIVLEAGNYTINGATLTTTAEETIYLDEGGAHFDVSGNEIKYNSFTFDGSGAASIANDLPTLTAGISVERPERAMVVLTEAGQNTIDGRGFWMTEALSDGITVGAVENGIGAAHIIPYESFPEDAGKLFAEEALIYGDDSYTVRLNKDGIKSIYGLSAGSTVRGTAYFEGEIDTLGSVLQLGVDNSGAYTFGDKTYTLNGAIDSVNVVAFSSRFYTEGTSALKNIYYLNGTVSGDFSSAVTVNQASMGVQILGDTNVDIYATDKAKAIDDAGKTSISSSGNAVSISGVGNGASIVAAGGATVVSTNEEGSFTFRDGNDTLQPVQSFTVTGDSSVDFVLRNYTDANGNPTMQVEGVDNLENGTYTITKETEYHAINAGKNISSDDELVMQFSDKATFVIADSKIVSVSGVDTLINRLKGDVTVHATHAVTVNEVDANVVGDTDFDVIVSDSKTTEIVNISAGASLSVASVLVETDNNGDFHFGESVYTINDADGSVTFVTNSDKEVSDVTHFSGTMKTNLQSVTVNGAAFTTTNTDVTISSAGVGISQVNGIVSGDTVGGDLDTTTIIFPAQDSNSAYLTVNTTDYTLTGDADNVSITGNRIDGLDSSASLEVSAAGTYTVNGASLRAKAGDIFVGTAEGSAYIYDPNNVPLNVETMTKDEISAQVGISTTYTEIETNSSVISTLIEAGSTALAGSMALAVDNIPQLDLSNSPGRKRVTLEGGIQNLIFNNEGGNVVVIGTDAEGEKNITLGSGGDLAILDVNGNPIDISAFNGSSTIVSSGEEVTVDLGNTGDVVIVPNSGGIALRNYNPNTEAGIRLNDVSDVARAIEKGNITLGDGYVSFGEATVNFETSESGANVVNFFNNLGVKKKVAYTSSTGGEVDLSGSIEDLLLVGNKNSENSAASRLVAGSGNDVAFGGEGDYFDLGAGANKVVLSEVRTRRIIRDGATIALTATSGITEVTGFQTGFTGGSDNLNIDLTNATASYKNGALTFSNGGASLVIDVQNSSADLADSADLFDDANFVGGTTLDDITPITYEQGDYQNIYTATNFTSQDTITAAFAE